MANSLTLNSKKRRWYSPDHKFFFEAVKTEVVKHNLKTAVRFGLPQQILKLDKSVFAENLLVQSNHSFCFMVRKLKGNSLVNYFISNSMHFPSRSKTAKFIFIG